MIDTAPKRGPTALARVANWRLPVLGALGGVAVGMVVGYLHPRLSPDLGYALIWIMSFTVVALAFLTGTAGIVLLFVREYRRAALMLILGAAGLCAGVLPGLWLGFEIRSNIWRLHL